MEPTASHPVPILALDVASAAEAHALLDRVGPAADFVKVGLQLFVAEGPSVVRALRERGVRVFLDLKLHDIPNTVAHAVLSAAELGVDLLTVHASGGAAMLRAASRAAESIGAGRPRLLGVTVLTSLTTAELADAWGRPTLAAEEEVRRLAAMSEESGIDGVVASVHELPAIRGATRPGFLALTPGIRLPGGDAGDQARVATPGEAARLGADYLVIGRAVTAAADAPAAMRAVLADLAGAGAGV